MTGYPTEYGRLAGGVMTMALKTGTNKLHGTLFEYLRNDAFDARNFFDTTRSNLRRHQFGGTLNGPAVIPKLYNGRNRTFFLGSWERYRQTQGVNRLGRVPAPLERAGYFSQTLNRPQDASRPCATPSAARLSRAKASPRRASARSR